MRHIRGEERILAGSFGSLIPSVAQPGPARPGRTFIRPRLGRCKYGIEGKSRVRVGEKGRQGNTALRKWFRSPEIRSGSHEWLRLWNVEPAEPH